MDAIAIAAALANPWASVVLSGAVTPGQLESNLAALAVTEIPRPGLAEPPAAYWSARSGRPGNNVTRSDLQLRGLVA